VTLLTLLPAAVGRGEPVAMRIKLWRPAPGGLCYRPDPVSKPNDCAYPKRGTPLPLCCLSPIVLIRNDASGAARRLRALPIKRYALDGRYQALIQFPTRGAWSVWVDDRHGGLHDLGVIHASR
jgi:hypothetical protein